MSDQLRNGQGVCTDSVDVNESNRLLFFDQKTSLLGRIYLSIFGRRCQDENLAEEAAAQKEPENFAEVVRQSLPKLSGFSQQDVEKVLERQKKYVFNLRENNGGTLYNSVAIVVGVLVSSLYMNILSTTTTFNRHNLKYLLPAPDGIREEGKGVLTVVNHRSVLDDPFLLSAITPFSLAFKTRYVRWGTCASDMCFTSRVLDEAMRAVKTLPVVRFCGLEQQEISHIVNRLNRGDWVNYFPEGRVSQGSLGRVRRGVGKIVCEAGQNNKGITVLPIYHEGIDQLMPHNERNELKHLTPRVGKRIWAIIGEPVEMEDIITKAKTCKGDECTRLYEEAADRIAVVIRLLRADLRKRAAKEYKTYLGNPYET
eukprot:Plantae.Rhodophyta-Purpureofilum_apyrenoidigerum.ctg10667.p1 GENE.Plantae.Rhodophyta-Purpureofilum_apyrenoidigerum.ctg10667~~Plantae.Rhodophyta-Purpureofilum_apyrenoidigerum.ctg10667.p1  ORF type:complete len:369 (+),score=49.40 Plantae.Rhodophyta-Purpureofilum_apyrenoidigerum.ctg10667:391-1497(+)